MAKQGERRGSVVVVKGGSTEDKALVPIPALDNPLTFVAEHPDLTHADLGAQKPQKLVKPIERPRTKSVGSFAITGPLFKHTQDGADGRVHQEEQGQHPSIVGRVGHALTSAVSAAATAAAGEWRYRYVVVDKGAFQYYPSEAAYLRGHPGNLLEPQPLYGYEVLVDVRDTSWGFALSPALQDSDLRTWRFRAASEEERREWVDVLVAVTIVCASSRY